MFGPNQSYLSREALSQDGYGRLLLLLLLLFLLLLLLLMMFFLLSPGYSCVSLGGCCPRSIGVQSTALLITDNPWQTLSIMSIGTIWWTLFIETCVVVGAESGLGIVL